MASPSPPAVTNGSTAKTFLFGIAVTVAVMDTPFSLNPCAPKLPFDPSPRAASGVEVYLNSFAKCGAVKPNDSSTNISPLA